MIETKLDSYKQRVKEINIEINESTTSPSQVTSLIKKRNLISDKIFNEDPSFQMHVKFFYNNPNGSNTKKLIYTKRCTKANNEGEIVYKLVNLPSKTKESEDEKPIKCTFENGTIMNCMHCKNIYYLRYRDSEGVCTNEECKKESFQQEISEYGVTV